MVVRSPGYDIASFALPWQGLLGVRCTFNWAKCTTCFTEASEEILRSLFLYLYRLKTPRLLVLVDFSRANE